MSQHLTPQLQLDAVGRALELIGEAGHVSMKLSLERGIEASAEEVWAALSKPERLAQWFGEVTGALEVGGTYSIDGGVSGTVLECAAPRRLALTWEDGSSVSDVVVEVEPSGQGSVVRLLHAAEIPVETWAEFGAGASGVGWDLSLLSLQRHLEEGVVEPLEATEWIESQEARDFMADSARRWGDVSIEAGWDAAETRAAAERTRAFYTGEL